MYTHTGEVSTAKYFKLVYISAVYIEVVEISVMKGKYGG